MTDALSKLPRFAWRGVEYPLLSRSVQFSHDDTDHTFQYRDGDLIERKGARNWTFNYTIPFREDIAKGPYRQLFIVELYKFVAACRDRSPDVMRDPVLGSFRAVCTTYKEETDVNKRDGADVQVEFKHAPESDLDQVIIDELSGIGLVGDVGLLDAEVERVNWPPQVPSPGPSTDILSAINGFGRQIEQQGHKISAALDGLAYKAEQIEQTAARLEDPHTFQLQRSSRRVMAAALRAKTRLENPERAIVQTTIAYTKSITAIAREAHMTVAQLLLLNPRIAGRPMVPPGTKIATYKAA